MIASEVKEFKVFQRAAQYAIPMRNPAYFDADRFAWRARYPEVMQKVLTKFGGFDHDLEHRAYRDLTPGQRVEILEQIWPDIELR